MPTLYIVSALTRQIGVMYLGIEVLDMKLVWETEEDSGVIEHDGVYTLLGLLQESQADEGGLDLLHAVLCTEALCECDSRHATVDEVELFLFGEA